MAKYFSLFVTLFAALVFGGIARAESQIVTVDSAGNPVMAHSALNSSPLASTASNLSADGRYVAFVYKRILYLYDRVLKITQNALPEDFDQSVGFTRPALSDDGRFIVFTTASSVNVLLLDRQTKTIKRLSSFADDRSISSEIFNIFISRDGRYVSYQTRRSQQPSGSKRSAKNLILLVHDRQTGLTTEIADYVSDSVMAQKANLLVFLSEDLSRGLSTYDLVTKQVRLIASNREHSFYKFSNNIPGLARLGVSANGRWLSFAAIDSDNVPRAVLHDRLNAVSEWIPRQTYIKNQSSGIERVRISNDGRYITYNLVFFRDVSIGRRAYQLIEYDNIFTHDRETGVTTALLTDDLAYQAEIRGRFVWIENEQSLAYLGDPRLGNPFQWTGSLTIHRFSSTGRLSIRPLSEIFQHGTLPESFHEGPAGFSAESGLGLIRGWVCKAEKVAMQIDNRPWIELPYGINREDTRLVCGNSNNGYAYLSNWNLLGAGQHRIRILADNTLIADQSFTVTTLGQAFITGLNRTVAVENFPSTGDRTKLQWSEPHQNFVITDYIPRNE